jgi:hypothetical protein
VYGKQDYDNSYLMENLEMTGTCPLIKYTGSDEYQLPTQKHQEQLKKTLNLNSKKCGSKNHFKITDKILRLYNTPDEREMPHKRARSITARRARKENPCIQKELVFPILENNYSTKTREKNTLQLSDSFMNGCLKKPEQIELRPLASVTNNEDSCVVYDKSLVSQFKVLDQIRPIHPQFAKEIKVNSKEALKINSLILTERLKVQLTPTTQHRITFPSIENTSQSSTTTSKCWLKNVTKTNSTPCLDATCKLCELNAEYKAKNGEHTRNNTLHIDLKRLTEVRSKNWSSYGHYTKVRKLRYTKRQKNLLKNKDKQVEVDEDYLSVDVDKLMNIYEEKSVRGVAMESGRIDAGDIHTKSDVDPGRNACSPVDNDKENVSKQETKSFTCQDLHAPLQRPTTTKLRSCINFTSRKTCFTNAS